MSKIRCMLLGHRWILLMPTKYGILFRCDECGKEKEISSIDSILAIDNDTVYGAIKRIIKKI